MDTETVSTIDADVDLVYTAQQEAAVRASVCVTCREADVVGTCRQPILCRAAGKKRGSPEALLFVISLPASPGVPSSLLNAAMRPGTCKQETGTWAVV